MWVRNTVFVVSSVACKICCSTCLISWCKAFSWCMAACMSLCRVLKPPSNSTITVLSNCCCAVMPRFMSSLSLMSR
ncbi:hypothetical protein THIOM_001732 [Candidatus Thiomargarita nelsonii]|uniref:Secreted protein n=1 Tax=Candidatus Thiomargarita nelsonii TaxID=1003181 RepID=A0A176S320_9GAMM|nr:hypothetical protein THIOM_001732 [Candidatus Thiomargarita nelsonii]